MKKVLLGLLALSATLMASTTTPPSTGVTGTAGENQIDITTKAFIVDSGLIITETESGTAAIKSIELDHGTVLKTNPAGSTVNRDIYIRKSNYQAFPENSVLEITLQSTTNNLENGSNIIPHALGATIELSDALATKGTQTLLLANASQNSNNTFTTLRDAASVKINLRSDISTAALAAAEEGAYSNTSTLSVKFSKIPTAPGTPANSQPAVPLSR